MWWKQSESIHFDWIMTDLFSVCWEYENALTDWSDEKWRTEFKQKIADRGYSKEIQEFVQNELERFLPWRVEELARWKAEEEAKRLEKEQQEREEKEWQEEIERLLGEGRTPFEEVLNEVFENAFAIMDAAYEWSDDDWHNNFEEKIIGGIKDGRFTEEIAIQIRKDLDAYMKMLQKEKEEYEKEEEILRKKREEQERLEREELEKMWAEDKAREQRKAKQLPEVLELIDAYNLARKKLEEVKSTEHYHKVFDVCYGIIRNWNIVGCLDEFEGVSKYYEECALDYLETTWTIDSLYYIVFYYTNSEILMQYNDLMARKQHLKRGMEYVKAFHDIVNDEKSALVYINYYVQMNQCCRTGEDLEAFSYIDKAYKLAKKFALKYKSQIMLNELDMTKLGITVYYRMHDQEMEVERVEKEFEEIKKKLHL